MIEMKFPTAQAKRLAKCLEEIPQEATRRTAKLTAEKANKMAATMRTLAPADTGMLRDSIRVAMDREARGLRAWVIAGWGGRVARARQFGWKGSPASRFFSTAVGLYAKKFNASITRSIRMGIKRAAKKTGAA